MIKWLDPYQGPLPAEAVSNRPRVVWYGRGKVLVEQHRGILTCREEEMGFDTVCGRLIIGGSSLVLEHYAHDTAVICGEISTISYGGRSLT